MSTQNPATLSIPFTHSHPQQNFRLLELPPDLLELLSSANPPTLHLKSFPPDTQSQTPSSTTSSLSTVKDAHVRLCTPTQTYQVRQVSSSNSVFIVKPTSNPLSAQNVSADEEAMELDSSGLIADTTTTNGLTAIALCPSTLELHPQERSLSRAAGYLKDVLPVYKADEWNVEKGRVYDDVPLSTAEIDEAWRHLCAFEIDESAWKPSARTKMEAWNMVRVALDIAKDSELASVTVKELVSNLGVESKYRELVSDPDGGDENEWLDSSEDWARSMRDDIWGGLESHKVLDREKGVRWIGALFLEDATTKEESRRHVKTGWLSVDEFLERWRDALPERWREDVTGLEVLDRSVYEITNTGLVRWADATAAAQVIGAGGLYGGDAGAERSGGKGGASRKWHEKFKAGRK